MSSDVNTRALNTPIMRIKGEDEILSEILYLIIIVSIFFSYVQSRLKTLTFHMATYPQKADQYLFFQVCRVHNWGTSDESITLPVSASEQIHIPSSLCQNNK